MTPRSLRQPTVVVDLELSKPFPPAADFARFGDARVLCRLHGRPVAFVAAPLVDGRLDWQHVVRTLVEQHAWPFARMLAERAIDAQAPPDELDAGTLFGDSGPRATAALPVTVAVCTRDRAGDLDRCLAALTALDYQPLDLLVVDNAPATNQTRRLVAERYPQVRYVCEPRPGLDWARNRAILECRGELLAFTDDDVVVDRGWVRAIVDVFAAAPSAMAVTGLVIPDELESDAQRLFEAYGGFGRGFMRRWYRAASGKPVAPMHGGTGKFGTGANMAFRRSLFDAIGGFDPALDVGTSTNGGGDLDMFFRVLKAGHTLVYEPAAIVRHRHRRTYAELRTQIANNGVGFYSYLTRIASAFPDERDAVRRLGTWWLRWWNLRRLVRASLRKEPVPLDLVLAELAGSLRGLRRYAVARANAEAVRQRHPDEPSAPEPSAIGPGDTVRLPEAMRTIELSQPLQAIDDAAAYERVRVVLTWQRTPIGTAVIDHHGAHIDRAWLRDALSEQLAMPVLDAGMRIGASAAWSSVVAAISRQLVRRLPAAPPATRPSTMPVSVVVATYDRPDDLRRCLASLAAQVTSHPVEVIVVDNHPESGVTAPVVAAFAGVRLVPETRGGLSFARNRGIAAATGEVIATTDDDVVCPPDWVENLVRPFAQHDVMVVTGNVLPLEVENDTQRLFEAYGGLGRGFTRQRVTAEWFAGWRRAVPTWELGCTANAAFRASIFRHPAIGLMDEALGAGTPTGCSEDTYVFYRVLRAGYAIVYEPDAFVWHRHRNTEAALRRQIYSYSKGHVAYHLTTWLRDGDVRGLVRLGYELPRVYARRAVEHVRGSSDYPLRYIGLEILGCLAGPWALWQSRRRVRRLGASAPLSVPHPVTAEPAEKAA